MVRYNPIVFLDDIVDMLHAYGIINDATFNVLELAESHCGYIAGGFAEFIASTLFTQVYEFAFAKVNYDDVQVAIQLAANQRLLAPKVWSAETVKSLRNYVKVPFINDHDDFVDCVMHQRNDFTSEDVEAIRKRTSDIDVWFPTYEDFNAFTHDCDALVREGHVVVFKTHMVDNNLSLIEYMCSGGNSTTDFAHERQKAQVVQAIGFCTGTPEEVVDTFDIYNAMCYIIENVLYIPVEWEWLRAHNLAHIHRTDIKTLVRRIHKYVTRHNYHCGLTPSSQELFNTIIEKIVDDFIASGLECNGEVVTRRNFIGKFFCITDALSMENLTLLSSLLPHDHEYNEMFRALKSRHLQELMKSDITKGAPRSQYE